MIYMNMYMKSISVVYVNISVLYMKYHLSSGSQKLIESTISKLVKANKLFLFSNTWDASVNINVNINYQKIHCKDSASEVTALCYVMLCVFYFDLARR